MIKHVLKDGTVLKDIRGHKVSRKDAPRVYELLERKKGRGIDDGRTQKTQK